MIFVENIQYAFLIKIVFENIILVKIAHAQLYLSIVAFENDKVSTYDLGDDPDV